MLTYRISASAIVIVTLAIQWGCANKTASQNSQNRNEQSSASSAANSERQSTQERITEIVAKQLGIEPRAVDLNLPLSKQQVAADELDVVEIVMRIEEELKIEIKDEEIDNDVGSLRESLSVTKLAEIVYKKKNL